MKIYNTLTRQKEEFEPLEPGKAKIYVCGPTVYNYIHIGNARPMVVFDTLRKYLIYKGYEVKYVQNYTDVDDKIINKAKEEGVTAPEVSEKFIEEYLKDAHALGVMDADVHPKVSEHIPEIESFVSTLINKGYAYEADGDVYFSTRKFPEYGKLSGQNIDELEEGKRIAIGEVKEDPLDFALWKARKEESEIAWESDWGLGRPGWHIECSAMAKKHLGETIDIHAGGEDLQFPHHENEIAQSECCNGVTFAKYWMHNGFITIDKEKMSKSKGNFFTVRDILQEYSGEEIRFFLLSGHYRGPIDFSRDHMEQSRAGLERLKNCMTDLKFMAEKGEDSAASDGEEMMTNGEHETLKTLEEYKAAFEEAMDDDLNTADAITALFEMATAINTELRGGASRSFARDAITRFRELADILGIVTESDEDDGVGEEVEKLVAERQAARTAKDFAKADEIRDKLKEMGITLKDTPQGVQIIKES